MTDYVKPATIEEALQFGSQKGAVYLGGGTWLNSREAGDPERLISLDELDLAGITDENGVLCIGAAMRFQEMLDSGGLPGALADAVESTASKTLRNMATLGGDLALHKPASCVVPALVVLDAVVALAGDAGTVCVEEYLKSDTSSLILEVRIPQNDAISSLRFLSRTSHSIKTLVCAVACHIANGVLEHTRVSVSDCVTGSKRLVSVETALEGKTIPPKPEIEALVMGGFDPEGDFHAGDAYKRYLAGVTVADMIHELAAGEVKS